MKIEQAGSQSQTQNRSSKRAARGLIQRLRIRDILGGCARYPGRRSEVVLTRGRVPTHAPPISVLHRFDSGLAAVGPRSDRSRLPSIRRPARVSTGGPGPGSDRLGSGPPCIKGLYCRRRRSSLLRVHGRRAAADRGRQSDPWPSGSSQLHGRRRLARSGGWTEGLSSCRARRRASPGVFDQHLTRSQAGFAGRRGGGVPRVSRAAVGPVVFEDTAPGGCKSGVNQV
jgi:hypothetical protein